MLQKVRARRVSPPVAKGSLVAFVSCCALAGGGCTTASAGGGRLAQGDTPYAAIDRLARVLVEVEDDYVDPVDREKLLNGAIKGMVAELDPHSSYMPPEEFQAFENDTEGAFGGIGVEVEERRDQLMVLAPIEGSPADRAGIRAGDAIVSIDGNDPWAEPLDELVKRLRGAPGSHVKVGVQRDTEAAILSFDLVREIVHVQSVSSKLLADRVAYVHIKQFQEHTHDELLAAAAKLRGRAGGALAGIVLDLRGDPGGLVDQATDVADEFLDEGVIFTTRHRGQVVDDVRARAGGAFSREPCVVLVNQYTASASELLAGALQDHKRASIVGEPTFGKGSVQSIIALPGGAGMRLTIARYYTPSGHAIQADGIHPDVVVETPKQEGIVSYREKDLEGHLAAESAGRATAEAKAAPVLIVDGGIAAEPLDTGGSEARGVPDDPSLGTDPVLKIGWQVLHQAMKR
jgi:carboxyl-terminal processing protease